MGLRVTDKNGAQINISTITYQRKKVNIPYMFEELEDKVNKFITKESYGGLLNNESAYANEFYVFYGTNEK